MKITQIDRTACRQISGRVKEALEVVSEELGLNITVHPGRFRADQVTFKVEASTGNAEDAYADAARDFKTHCVVYGLKKTDLGKTVYGFGTSGVIIGCKPQSPKYPILVREANGKVKKWPVEAISPVSESD